MKTIAERLKAIREAHGWTQAVLGEHLGLSGSAIAFYERGQRQPRGAIIKKIEAIERGEGISQPRPINAVEELSSRAYLDAQFAALHREINDLRGEIRGMLLRRDGHQSGLIDEGESVLRSHANTEQKSQRG